MKNITCIVAFIIFSFQLVAQSDTLDIFNLSVEELLRIKVFTVSKKIEKFSETPAYINILTENEIRELNFTSLEEILEYMTGVASLAAEGNVFTTTTIRGNTLVNYNTNTLLLFNGAPIFNPYHGSFDLRTIPLSSIRQIEVVKGSNSVLYGTNAINGVINIIPKKSDENTENFSGRISAGSYRTGSFNAAYSMNKNNLNVSVFGDGLFTQAQSMEYFNENDGTTFEMRRKLKQGNIAALAEYKGLQLQFQFANKDINHIDGNSLASMYYYDDDTLTSNVGQHTDEFQIVGSIAYNKEINPSLGFSIRSTYQDWQLDRTEPAGIKNYISWGSYNEVELNHCSKNERLNNKFGVNVNHYNGYRFRSRIVNGELVEKYDVAPDKIPTTDFALYVNGSYGLLEKLNIHYGGRYYLSNYNGNSATNFSPRLAIVSPFSDKYTVKAIFGQSFRVPTYFEKASTSITAFGNPGLSPETSTSFDIVFSGKQNKLTWDLDLFYSVIDNKIVRLAGTEQDSIDFGIRPSKIFKNSGSYTYMGIEANTKFILNDKLNGFVGYAFVNVTNNENIGSKIGDDPWYFPHKLNGLISYRPVKFFSASLSLSYMDKWGFGEGYEKVADSYLLANLGLNIYPIKEKDFRFEAKINNLFNQAIYRPEIAGRNLDTAPVVPYDIGAKFFFGMSYLF